MSRIVIGLSLACAFCTLSASPSLSQSQKGEPAPAKSAQVSTPSAAGIAPSVAPDGDAYDSRALRIESHWGRMTIVRGADGPVVGTAGVFRTADVAQIVAGSPRAEEEARLFKASHRSGAVASALGALTFGVGLIATTNTSNNAATPILMIGGLGSILWGARRLDSAYSSLSRAVWWYNRDLKSRD